jgi:hypothetical protein
MTPGLNSSFHQISRSLWVKTMLHCLLAMNPEENVSTAVFCNKKVRIRRIIALSSYASLTDDNSGHHPRPRSHSRSHHP